MTYRERLADLICGCALTRARVDAAKHLAWGNERHADWLKASDALRAIIANDTPGANATVKRMVKIAKGGLE